MAKVISRPAARGLYDEDFPLWAERQAALCGARRFDELDLEDLIEEVEHLSRRERDTVESYLETVLEHLLKLELSNAGRPRRGWLVTRDKQRAKLARADDHVATASKQSYRPFMPGFDDLWPDNWRKTAGHQRHCPRPVATLSTRSWIPTGCRRTCTVSKIPRPEADMLLSPWPPGAASAMKPSSAGAPRQPCTLWK